MNELALSELALFAGVGGGLLGSILSGFRTVCAVEKEPYCREVLLRRQRDSVLPMFPIWDDIRTFDGKPWRGTVDIVTAGFPCQPFSVAGRRKGSTDERNLWPDTIRVIREVGAPYALLENVPHILAHDYFGEILGDLAEAGFDAEWGVISAAECGAPHIRERLWIAATIRRRKWSDKPPVPGEFVPLSCSHELWAQPWRRKWEGRAGAPFARNDGKEVYVADAAQLTEREPPDEADAKPGSRDAREEPGGGGWWILEPLLGRVADGVPHRVDRLRALGNAQVPRVAQEAWRRLKS